MRARMLWMLVCLAPIVARAEGSPAPMPEQESKLVATVADFAGRYAGSPNEMAAGALRPDRMKTLCNLPFQFRQAHGAIKDWIGTVETLSSTNDGKGILSVRISPEVSVGTYNNGFSDSGAHTLIPPGSPLHAKAVALQVGQIVRFSGMFFPDHTDCLKETSLTTDGGMKQPDFLFRFSDVAPAQ